MSPHSPGYCSVEDLVQLGQPGILDHPSVWLLDSLGLWAVAPSWLHQWLHAHVSSVVCDLPLQPGEGFSGGGSTNSTLKLSPRGPSWILQA